MGWKDIMAKAKELKNKATHQNQQNQQNPSQETANVSPDSAANICKSNGNLQKFQGELGGCRTSADNNNISTFFSKLDDVPGFFEAQFAQFNDMISTGDKFYGSSANATVLAEVVARNKDLQASLESLQKENKQLVSTTERHERDFLDVKGALPERIPTQNLNVLDDYTMLLLTISYLVMALSIIFYYTQVNNYTISSILISTVGMALITCIVYLMTLMIL
jgi:hypothetical protein